MATGSKTFVGRLWWDVVTLKEAAVVAMAPRGDHFGEPAVTRNCIDKWSAWYLVTSPDAGLTDVPMNLWTAEADVTSLGKSKPGVELSRRRTDSHDYLLP